jgi:hypothetical protein
MRMTFLAMMDFSRLSAGTWVCADADPQEPDEEPNKEAHTQTPRDKNNTLQTANNRTGIPITRPSPTLPRMIPPSPCCPQTIEDQS